MYIRVHVQPGAKREKVEKIDDTYHISVREPAERNLANRRICELIAREYGVPTRSVKIIAGHHSPGKMVVVNS